VIFFRWQKVGGDSSEAAQVGWQPAMR
jgi:hypothetical protein